MNDVEIIAMSTEICSLKKKVKEMGTEVDSHEQRLRLLSDEEMDDERIMEIQ